MTSISLRCAHEHIELVEAIANGFAERAQSLITNHIRTVHQRVLADFNQQGLNEVVAP